MRQMLKIGVSGVRGVVGESFTPQLASSIAQAFGVYAGRGRIVVGRDTRPSGEMIELAVVAGLQAVGCKPVLVGVAPTPTVLMLTHALDARGGIAITASHNPGPWNALKLINNDGLFLDETRMEEVIDIYHQGDFPLVPEIELLRVDRYEEPMRDHIWRILQVVDADAICQQRFHVAVDCCNGVGAVYSQRFLEEALGCRVTPLFDQPNGLFEREPEPLPRNLEKLKACVKEQGCQIGFAQDPDGDRLAVVDETGRAIGEDLTLALCMDQVLTHHAKGPVVATVSTSKRIDFIARRHGVEVVRTKVGEINVVDAMQRLGAVIGGENNGGVILPAVHACRDSFTAMALLLELLTCSGKSVAQLFEEIPTYCTVKDKVPIKAVQTPRIMRHIRQSYANRPLNLMDGVWVDFGESWVHVRRSNTEPVIRIVSEAPTPEAAQQLAAEFRRRIEEML